MKIKHWIKIKRERDKDREREQKLLSTYTIQLRNNLLINLTQRITFLLTCEVLRNLLYYAFINVTISYDKIKLYIFLMLAFVLA